MSHQSLIAGLEKRHPLPKDASALSWAESLANELWQPTLDAIEAVRRDCPLNPFRPKDVYAEVPPEVVASAKGHELKNNQWYKLVDGGTRWKKVASKRMPKVVFLDFESSRFKERGDEHFIPILCMAWGDGHWYIWRNNDPNVLYAPFPPNRIVINHNVLYDARYLSCEYKHPGSTLFLDTLSMACAIYSISSQQLPVWKLMDARRKEGANAPAWYNQSCPLSLKDLVEHCFGHQMPKEVRDGIVQDYYSDWYKSKVTPKSLCEYCADDVFWARKLFYDLLDKLMDPVSPVFSSPVTWAGMLELGRVKMYLSGYEEFIEKSNEEWKVEKRKLSTIIRKIADKHLKRYNKERKRWLAEQGVADLGELLEKIAELDRQKELKKQELIDLNFDERFVELNASMSPLLAEHGSKGEVYLAARKEFKERKAVINATQQEGVAIKKERAALNKQVPLIKKKLKELDLHLEEWGKKQDRLESLDWKPLSSGDWKGYPKWYRVLAQKSDTNPGGFSPTIRIAITLLKLRWMDNPVVWHHEEGEGSGAWCHQFWLNADGVAPTLIAQEKLPHPQAEGGNLSNPFCKDYIHNTERGVLSSDILSYDRLLQFHRRLLSLGQWTSYRKRHNRTYAINGMTKTDCVPCKTQSRRMASSLWVVAPKPNETKIGSTFMFAMTGKPGWVVAGSDLDSQESLILSMLTDAFIAALKGIIGIGLNGWSKSVLEGDKNLGTDIHSMVADFALKGIEDARQHAKFLNFGSAYGAGLEKLAMGLKRKLNVSIEKATEIARKFLDYLKGPSGIAKECFQVLKRLAMTPEVRTSILGVKIPHAIDYRFTKKTSKGRVTREFMTTAQNWNIQSSGVDQLHLLVTIIGNLTRKYGVECELLVPIHDAVYYTVNPEHLDKFKAILDFAHHRMQLISYEQVGIRVPQQLGMKPVALKPHPKKIYYSKIKAGQSIGEFESSAELRVKLGIEPEADVEAAA